METDLRLFQAKSIEYFENYNFMGNSNTLFVELEEYIGIQ